MKGACKDLTTAYVNACPSEADSIAKCKNFFAGIAMSCSGGPSNTIDTTP